MELQEHKRLIELLPEFLQEYREFRTIMDTEQIELNQIFNRINDFLSDLFINTATEDGIARREQMYGIVPEEGAALEERRVIVKAKEAKSLPYTIRQYREMLSAMCGEGNYKILLDPGKYSLDVKVRAVLREGRNPLQLLRSINEMTELIKPANILYNSALFDYHNTASTVYSGAAAAVHREYRVEVL